MRRDNGPASNCEKALNNPTAKKTPAVTPGESPHSRCSHNTRSDCTTNPLAPASRENSAASSSTVPRDCASGFRATVAISVATCSLRNRR